jgi:hypothetical protein
MAESTRFTLSFENLKAWCLRNQYSFSEDAKRGHLALPHQLLGQPTPIMLLPQRNGNSLAIVMRQPYEVPQARYAAIIEAITLLHANAVMGTWVLNREFGELYFRVTLPVSDIQYTDAGVLYTAQVVLRTSEEAGQALRAIALDGAEPIKTMSAVINAAAAVAAATLKPDAPT